MEPKDQVNPVKDKHAEKYCRRTRFLREATRVSLLVSGLGLVVVGPWSFEMAVFLGVGLLGLLTATLGLYLDYLLHLRVEGRSPSQLSLLDLMLTTAAVSGLLGLFNLIGWNVVWTVIPVVIGLGGFLEDLNRIQEADLASNEEGDVLRG